MKHICLAASDLGYVRKHFGTELWNHVQELTVDDLGYTEPRFPAEITRILPLLTNLKHLKIGLAYHIIDFPDATSGVDLETEVEDFVQNVLSYPDVKPFMSLRGLESLTLEELQPNCCRKCKPISSRTEAETVLANISGQT